MYTLISAWCLIMNVKLSHGISSFSLTYTSWYCFSAAMLIWSLPSHVLWQISLQKFFSTWSLPASLLIKHPLCQFIWGSFMTEALPWESSIYLVHMCLFVWKWRNLDCPLPSIRIMGYLIEEWWSSCRNECSFDTYNIKGCRFCLVFGDLAVWEMKDVIKLDYQSQGWNSTHRYSWWSFLDVGNVR